MRQVLLGLRRPWVVVAAVLIVLGTCLQLLLVRLPLSGDLYSFRQAHNSLVVREFMRHGFDWRMPLPVFGENSFVPMEFPTFHALAATAGSVGHLDPAVAARLIGILCFQVSAVLVLWLGVRWFNRTAGIASVALYEFSAFGFYWGHAALMDFMAAALMLGAVVLLDVQSRASSLRRSIALSVAASVLCAIGFLTKSTTGIVLIPMLFIPAITAWRESRSRGWWQAFLPPASAVLASAALTWAWTEAADRVKAANPWTAWLTSANLQQWNFGTLSQRLDPQTWLQVVDVTWGAIVGGLLLYLVVGALAIIGWRWRPSVIILFLIPLLGPLIFINLYWIHSYYSIAVYPVIVLLASSALGLLERTALERRSKLVACFGVIITVIGVTWIGPQGREFAANLIGPHGAPDLSVRIAQVVPSGQGIILFACDWDPTVPFYADRPALMVVDRPGPRPSVKDLRRFTYAASCGNSEVSLSAMLQRELPKGSTWQEVAPNLYRLYAPAG